MALTNLRERYPSPARHGEKLRRFLEGQALAAHGVLSLEIVAVVNLAVKYELTSRIAERLVAEGKSANPVSDMKTACWATGMRNRCIANLGLNGTSSPTTDPWMQLDTARASSAGDSFEHEEPGP